MKTTDKTALLTKLLRERILILDGAMGTMIQGRALSEPDYRGPAACGLRGHAHDLKGDNDLLALTRPDVIRAIHDEFLAAGADIIETNTFNATRIAQADYRLETRVREINLAAARIARECADAWTAKTPDKPRFVAGALGPTNRTASISPDVNDPGARNVRFDESLGLGSGQPWHSGEETDFVVGALQAGARIEYDPSFVVVHPQRRPTAPELRALGARDGASVGFILRKRRYPVRAVARMLVRPLGGAAHAAARTLLCAPRRLGLDRQKYLSHQPTGRLVVFPGRAVGLTGHRAGCPSSLQQAQPLSRSR